MRKILDNTAQAKFENILEMLEDMGFFRSLFATDNIAIATHYARRLTKKIPQTEYSMGDF
jgi:hypothetical protein